MGKLGFDYDWLLAHPLYEALGPDADSRRQAYRRLFRAAMNEADVKAIRDSLHKGWALGNDRFRELPVREPLGADPHAGWCGEGRLEAGPYPIMRFLLDD